jgi:hypothetical protein
VDQPRQRVKQPYSLFGGGFSSILDEVFSQKNSQYFDYKVIGTESLDGKAAVVIKFETQKGPTGATAS